MQWTCACCSKIDVAVFTASEPCSLKAGASDAQCSSGAATLLSIFIGRRQQPVPNLDPLLAPMCCVAGRCAMYLWTPGYLSSALVKPATAPSHHMPCSHPYSSDPNYPLVASCRPPHPWLPPNDVWSEAYKGHQQQRPAYGLPTLRLGASSLPHRCASTSLRGVSWPGTALNQNGRII